MKSILVLLLLNLISLTLSLNSQKGVHTQMERASSANNSADGHCIKELLVGHKLKGKYLIERVIGDGTQAVVFSATYRGMQYAVKCFMERNKTIDHQDAVNEIEMLDTLDHQNIVQKVESFQENGNLYLVTEYCETDLFEAIFSLRSKRINKNDLFLQVLDAVVYLHQKGVYHRDLKPENILIKNLTNAVPKLADFGYATTEEQAGTDFRGTFGYSAPEILSRISSSRWDKNDIFSLGVILFILKTGMPPWYSTEMMLRMVASLEVYLPYIERKNKLSKPLMEIFRRVFGKADQRPTAIQFRSMFLDAVCADDKSSWAGTVCLNFGKQSIIIRPK